MFALVEGALLGATKMLLGFLLILAQEPVLAGMPPCERYSAVVRTGNASLPEIGEMRTAETGEPMLVSSQYEVRSGTESLEEEIVISGTTSRAPFTLVIPAGAAVNSDAVGSFVTTYQFTGRGIAPTMVHFENSGETTVARISWGWLKERHPVTSGVVKIARRECVSRPEGALRRQISFTGVSRGVVSLEYREFAGDLARPAFTQSATYDLSEGKTIGFRGARLEIETADNTGITYRVLRAFD